MSRLPVALTPFGREHFHPLEIIPFFRRFPSSFGRDFLYNTLANVAGLIDPDPAKARRMLESFIRFLRSSLGATRAESTTLADEGELMSAYLDVLQIRMGARLRYEID